MPKQKQKQNQSVKVVVNVGTKGKKRVGRKRAGKMKKMTAMDNVRAGLTPQGEGVIIRRIYEPAPTPSPSANPVAGMVLTNTSPSNPLTNSAPVIPPPSGLTRNASQQKVVMESIKQSRLKNMVIDLTRSDSESGAKIYDGSARTTIKTDPDTAPFEISGLVVAGNSGKKGRKERSDKGKKRGTRDTLAPLAQAPDNFFNNVGDARGYESEGGGMRGNIYGMGNLPQQQLRARRLASVEARTGGDSGYSSRA